ncbi:MAG TPA: PTS transporter subunit EIIC [Anaerolineaceae bacterium]|nr:PTS transporter subunit EIIC [Anaerolineaceae bacterium]
MSYEKLATELVEALGGAENISTITNCATRLRFALNDNTKYDEEKAKNIKGVIGVSRFGKQIQVVIGPQVNEVYKEIAALDSVKKALSSSRIKVKKAWMDIIFGYITNCIIPIYPAFIAGGLLKGILVLATNLKWISGTSAIYSVLYAASDAVFYFLPVLIAYSAAKYLKSNQVIAMIVALCFVMPKYTGILGTDIINKAFLVSYSSQLFPMLVAIPLASFVEKKLTEVIPNTLKSIIVPTVTVIVTVLAVFFCIGPITSFVGNVIYKAVNAIYAFSPLLCGTFVGGVSGYLTIIGAHLALIPIIILNITETASDWLLPMMQMTCMAQIAIAFAYFAAIKDRTSEKKAAALTAGLTGLLSNITEPALFGFVVENKMMLIYMGIAGAIGGALVGATGIVYSTIMSGIMTWIAASPTLTMNLLFDAFRLLDMAIAFVLAFTYLKKKGVEG